MTENNNCSNDSIASIHEVIQEFILRGYDYIKSYTFKNRNRVIVVRGYYLDIIGGFKILIIINGRIVFTQVPDNLFYEFKEKFESVKTLSDLRKALKIIVDF